MTGPSGEPLPKDWRLLVPDDWWRIPLLDREVRHRSIATLVERQFSGTSAPAALRVQTEQLLRDLTAESAGNYATDIWLSTRAVQDRPLACSLLCQTIPGAGDLTELADTLRDEPVWNSIDTDRTDAGRVIRRVTERVSGELPGTDLVVRAAGGTSLPVVVAEYWYAVPGWGALLQLTFSTPLVPLRDAFVELFDAVARSVEWVW